MYILYIHVYMKMFMIESMVIIVTKIKFKGKSIKVLYACMVHGKKDMIFFIEGREE